MITAGDAVLPLFLLTEALIASRAVVDGLQRKTEMKKS